MGHPANSDSQCLSSAIGKSSEHEQLDNGHLHLVPLFFLFTIFCRINGHAPWHRGRPKDCRSESAIVYIRVRKSAVHSSTLLTVKINFPMRPSAVESFQIDLVGNSMLPTFRRSSRGEVVNANNSALVLEKQTPDGSE